MGNTVGTVFISIGALLAIAFFMSVSLLCGIIIGDHILRKQGLAELPLVMLSQRLRIEAGDASDDTADSPEESKDLDGHEGAKSVLALPLAALIRNMGHNSSNLLPLYMDDSDRPIPNQMSVGTRNQMHVLECNDATSSER
ncbi:hypothetical protein M413DRAFT_29901 [Hebeloma cylindrosporum]|uniref:Uncharacterized protein n=1 Tax=Hebeloma cylindrosporum TaxID=76867 RepID=A0A0C3C503_HEBCY|nr:hypothetical protein M413DRAFT_29901 [Hebeloma cylindrosporum h7]